LGAVEANAVPRRQAPITLQEHGLPNAPMRSERPPPPSPGLPPASKPPAAAEGHGLTVHSRGGVPGPRLPHERDESSDSQATTDSESVAVGQQAHEDVTRGLVDTDRGPVVDAVYHGDPSPTPAHDTPTPAEPPGGAARGALRPGQKPSSA
jgi:hypothetical protein